MHEVFQNRFVAYKQPAWHSLGTVFDQPINAEEAFKLMGEFDVVKEPLFRVEARKIVFNQAEYGLGPILHSVKGKYVLTGHFPANKGEVAVSHHYGVVDERYELVSPKQLVSLWDMLVKANIETMGVLQKGKRFFMTTELESFDIKGDEHKNYLSIFSPHGTNQCVIGLISPVRTVCWNTYQCALAAAKEEYKVPHMKGAMNKIGAWMQLQYENVQARSAEIKAALDHLADSKVGGDEARDTYLGRVFPVLEDLEAEVKVQDTRTSVGMLYEG